MGKLLPIRWAWAEDIMDFLAKTVPTVALYFTNKIDNKGKVVLDCEFDWVDRFSNGLARAKKNGKYGFIDSDGNIVSDCCWDYVGSFQNVK